MRENTVRGIWKVQTVEAGRERGREERGSKEITWEPREDTAKMAELYRSQRTWGKGTEARGLERLMVGHPPVCQPR